jgi:conjugative relaxase-like TrwC/TraI family protein
MLSVKAITGGETYAEKYLSQKGDYYSEGEVITGQWMGHGAELLGLKGEVSLEEFEAIRQGNDPKTGEFLKQRKTAAHRTWERELQNGDTLTETATARDLYDFTVSAPKAVSVQALEDPRLIEAHKTAVAEMAAELERQAGSYLQKGGEKGTRLTSNLVISRWDHDSSRQLDPQLHTHLVAANMTYDAVEGKWKALAAWDIYQQREYLTEVYRNALAREVAKLGYQIEDRFAHGKDYGFGIAGMKESTLEKYSQRSAQRDEAIAEFVAANGRLPSDNEVARLVRDTRPEKLYEISAAELKARQLARMTPQEAQTLRELREAAFERGSIHQPQSADPSFSHAKEHVFERVSVAKDYELNTEALRHGRGRVDLSEVKAALLVEIDSGAVLRARGEVATEDSLKRELLMVKTINQGIGNYQPLGRPDFVVSDRLRPEQKAAVLAVLDSRDLAVNLQGAAGTGKTATLQELKRGLTENRRSAVAVAPTASAVEELQKVGFKDAMTVARLLADPKQQHELAGQVLIVDEAGMLASKDMAALLKIAKAQNARIVYSGDTAQIKSVSEGDALRVLERESNLKGVSLRQVQRQSNAQYKAAVEALRHHPAEGFAKLEAMGAIREVDWRLKAQEVAQEYRAAVAVPNRKGQERSVLVVAATHDEIKSVTYAIRQDRKRDGELKQGELFSQHTALNWTEAQKKQTKNYQPGQVLAFHKAVKGVAKNEALEVVVANRAGITARNAAGQTVQITGKQAKAFGVFEKQELEVSAGDKLLLQANWREKGFKATNGELVTVAAVKPDRIEFEDGREVPAQYRQFTHGYAVTAHRSQGKTVDFEVISADRMSQDLFYVSATRAREGLKVITSDSQALQESIGVSGDRQSASELARRAAIVQPHRSISEEELFATYQAQQAQKVSQPVIQKEHHHHVRTGIGISF